MYKSATLSIAINRILGATDDRVECIVSSTPQYSAELNKMVDTVFMDLERSLENVTVIERFNHSGIYHYIDGKKLFIIFRGDYFFSIQAINYLEINHVCEFGVLCSCGIL